MSGPDTVCITRSQALRSYCCSAEATNARRLQTYLARVRTGKIGKGEIDHGKDLDER